MLAAAVAATLSPLSITSFGHRHRHTTMVNPIITYAMWLNSIKRFYCMAFNFVSQYEHNFPYGILGLRDILWVDGERFGLATHCKWPIKCFKNTKCQLQIYCLCVAIDFVCQQQAFANLDLFTSACALEGQVVSLLDNLKWQYWFLYTNTQLK